MKVSFFKDVVYGLFICLNKVKYYIVLYGDVKVVNFCFISYLLYCVVIDF